MWSTDGSWLLMPREDGTIFKLDPEIEAYDRFELNEENQLDNLLFSFPVSTDGLILYSGDYLMPSIFRRPPWQLLITDTRYGSIRTFDLSTNEAREIKRLGGQTIEYQAWAPDGKQIAFIHSDSDSDTRQLSIMNADGSNVRSYDQITDPYGLAWSPDGSYIAVVEQIRLAEQRRNGNYYYDETIDYGRLAVVRLSDGFIQRFNDVLFTRGFRDHIIDDGSTLVSSRIEYQPSGNEIIGDQLEWSAMDLRIYFLTSEFSELHTENWSHTRLDTDLLSSTIYSIKADGTDRRTVFQSGPEADITGFNVSPDGRKILFTVEPNSRRYMKSSTDMEVLHIMNLHDRELQRLTNVLEAYTLGAWSFDSSKIAFEAEFPLGWGYSDITHGYFTARDGLFVMNSDGTDARMLLQWNTNEDIRPNEESWRVDPHESILEPVEYE